MTAVAAALQQARAVKDRLAVSLRDHPAVNGVGVARTQAGWKVKVNLVRAAPELDLPADIDGVPICVEVVGPIVAR